MDLFRKARERFRDHTRDDICAGLQALGKDAQMAARGRPEEKIETGFYTQSLGMIDIAEGPIRWVNVRKRQAARTRRVGRLLHRLWNPRQ